MKPLLLVDGYNVLHVSERYSELIEAKVQQAPYALDAYARARECLIADVASYAHMHRLEARLIFDAAQSKRPSQSRWHDGSVEVIFSKRGQSADELIEGYAREARLSSRKVVLVTSDNTIRSTIGCLDPEIEVFSSALFVRECQGQQIDCTRAQQEQPAQKRTLESRISADQRQKLWELYQKLNGK